MIARGAVAWGILTSVVLGCAPAKQSAVLADPTAREWTRVRQRLTSARALEPTSPFVMQLTVAMREPRTKKVFQARGALAIDPHRAMRMILVGPGGATALDVWVTDQKWRFVVPALSLHKTGGTDPEGARGLPIGFFRWWMLHPFDGRLLSAWMTKGDPIYLLRHGDDTILLRDHASERGHHVLAMRREGGTASGSEELEWYGRAPAPHAGDRARYVDGSSGLEVEVLVEEVGQDEPDPAAFLDPDAKGTEL